MTCSSQDVLPTLLLSVCETAAGPAPDLSAGAAVSVLVTFTAVGAANSVSLIGAPRSPVARSILLASSGEATRTVWLSSSLGGAIAGRARRVGTAAVFSATMACTAADRAVPDVGADSTCGAAAAATTALRTGAPFDVLSLDAGFARVLGSRPLVQFFRRVAKMHELQELDRLANWFRACGLRHGVTADQDTNEQAAN
jgi:hypothetical protein